MNFVTSCCVILAVTLMSTVSASTVKELTCDPTTPNGCNGYTLTNLKLESDSITPAVGQKANAISKTKFTRDDASSLCVELIFDAYSKPADDQIQVVAMFPGTKQGYPLFPSGGGEGKEGYGGKFKMPFFVKKFILFCYSIRLLDSV